MIENTTQELTTKIQISDITLQVGDTITGEPGTAAEVKNTGSGTAIVLQFTIPKGADGTTVKEHQLTVPYSGFVLNAATGLYECTVADAAVTAASVFEDIDLDPSCTTDAMLAAYLLLVSAVPVSGGVKFSASAKPASDVIVDAWEVLS